MTDATPTPPEASALPDWLQGDPRPLWKRPGLWLVVGLLVLALGDGVVWMRQRAAQQAPRYITEPLVRGDLALTVSADGTLEPTRSVNIGSELSGTVARVLVDVNDRVRKGQVMVELDSSKFQDQVRLSQGALDSARASVQQAQATAKEARVALQRLQEVGRLSGGKVPAATDLDAAQAALDRALAAEAAARAAVVQAEATLRTNQTNLTKAAIRSPIDGVVLTRSVEPGNAVAASLQAVTLFTVAEDLGHMKLSVNVDEADVGQIQVGQKAQFTVSAWPNRKYPAVITRVAYGSTITDNVVTYTTDLEVANPDLTLRPGMTATATIAATEHKNVLLVPRSALNFSPTAASAKAASGSKGVVSMLIPRPPSSGTRSAKADTRNGGTRQIWVLVDGQPKAVDVQLGLSNGRLTEVSGPGLQAGMAVITEQQSGTAP
jgi:HlyD family secretion protein